MNTDVKNRRNLELLAVKQVLDTNAGRDFISRLLERTGIHEETFQDCPYKHARRSGERAIGLWLRNEIVEAEVNLNTIN